MPPTAESRKHALTVCLLLSLSSLLPSAYGSGTDSDTLRFDAKWWSHAHSDEQQGFIYGYMDCRQPPQAPNASINDYQIALSATIEPQKTTDANAVTKAIEHAWKTLKSRPLEKGAEVYAERRHGFLDGEWWGEFGGRPYPSGLAAEDRGYLEGYLECASPPVTVRAVSHYQRILNQHYASENHSHDKIANVLEPLLHLTPFDEK